MTDPQPMKLSYTVDEACRELGLTEKQMRAAVARKRVASFFWCGRRLITREALEAYRQYRASRGPEPIAPATCGVYLLFEDDRVVYVGRSLDLRRRLQDHKSRGWRIERVEVIPCDPAKADWLEAELIRTLDPERNHVRYRNRAKRAKAASRELLLA